MAPSSSEAVCRGKDFWVSIVSLLYHQHLDTKMSRAQPKAQRRRKGRPYVSRLTSVVEVLQTLFIWVGESFLNIHVSVVAVLMVSVVAVTSAPVHVWGLATGAPSPAFAAVTSRHWNADVDGLMVWGQKGGSKYLLCSRPTHRWSSNHSHV